METLFLFIMVAISVSALVFGSIAYFSKGTDIDKIDETLLKTTKAVNSLSASPEGARSIAHIELPAGITAFHEQHNELIIESNSIGTTYSNTYLGINGTLPTEMGKHILYFDKINETVVNVR